MDKITWTNEQRKLGDLIPWPINPAQIKKDEARRLAESLDEFGQVQTLAISPTNEIYDGHQRQTVWMAQDKFGPDHLVDVRVSSRELTEDERKKLVIYLRKGAVGEFDFDILANNFELDDLLDWGFDAHELDLDLWQKEEPPEDPGAQIDRAEELREQWGVEPGQLWRISSKTADGEHRIICGDCTDEEVVARVMEGEKAGAVVTSPPYFVNKDYENETTWDEFIKLINEFINISSKNILGGGYLFINFSENTNKPIAMAELYRSVSLNNGFYWHSHRVWKRPASMPIYVSITPRPIGEIEYLHTYRYGRTEEKEIVRNLSISRLMLWETGGPERNGHDAAFPVEFIEKPIIIYSDPGAIIYEPFLGSGTTLIACECLSRLGRGIEISPAYVAVSLQRLADMGLEPYLDE